MPFVIEKRKHPRSPTKLSVKYRLLRDNPPKLQHAKSVDISNGGMSFRKSKLVPHKTPVLVEFIAPHTHRPISFVSEVVHAREHSAGNHFIIGVEFQQLVKS